VLSEKVIDVFAYIAYLQAKAKAEEAQNKFLEDINKNRRK
jgi:hypothetical protein